MEKERRNRKTKSVGNGNGTLYYSEKLKKWVYQYYIEGDPKRKTMTQKKKETSKEFNARVSELKNKLNNGTYVGKSKATVVSLALEHIERKKENDITSSRSYSRDLETLEQIKKTCRNFCFLPIQKVTISHIEDAKKEIKKYAQNTINKIWGLLNKSFSIACSPSRKILTFNIMQDEFLTKPISIKKTKKVYPLTQIEYQKLINVLDNEERNHPYRNIAKMQLISGMRIGEVVARSLDDFNVDLKQLNVWNTLTQDDKYNIIWGEHTKTYNKKTQIDDGQRFLPLDNPLFNGLISIINEQKNKKITNIRKLLFWDYEKNTFISPNEVNAWLNRLNSKYNISDNPLSTHRLRHHAITHWMEKGLPLSVIQYLAGHVEGSNITENVYIDISPDFVKTSLKKMM